MNTYSEEDFKIVKLIQEQLKKYNIHVPVEETFNYIGIQEVEKVKLFIRETKGNIYNSCYVKSPSNKNGPPYDYYDLLFIVHNGRPICVPVPIIRKLFNLDHIDSECFRNSISKSMYEHIFDFYYKYKKPQDEELPF